MVRLNERIVIQLYYRSIKFQFQYGTIKWLQRMKAGSLKLCFNSNMVRLNDRLSEIMDEVIEVSIPIWYD